MAENNEQVIVQAEIRNDRGKNDARRLRTAGKVPVTIYGGEGEAVSAVAKLSDLAAIIRSKTGISTLFKVAIDGQETEVMFHDRQINPLTGRLMHADLKRIVRGQKLEVTVPLELEGEPVGVTEEGAVLDHVLHQIVVRCRPSQIPESVKADVSGLHVNEVLHVSDLKADENIEFVTAPDSVVATVKFAKMEGEETAPATEDAEATAETAATTEETTESES
jgi:large subunit ribosomal protein L25